MKKTLLFLLCIVCCTLCTNLKAETLEEKVARLEAKLASLEAKTEATDSVITAEVVEPKKKMQPISVKFDARFDWQSSFVHHADAKPDYASNFNGRYIMFMLDGNISPKFSYSLRYRMIHPSHDYTWRGVFNATDWANLTYRPTKNWEITAGKMLVFYGSYEFDKNPLDVYMWSGWGGRVGCFQFGVLGKYITNDGRNNILFQINNSPFADPLDLGALYSYSVQWNGNFGVFNSLYSVNFFEYQPGRFVNYISLGNQFNFGPVTFELDYMNRYGARGTHFLKDFSLIGKLNYNYNNRFNVFVKGGLDYNMAQDENTPTEEVIDMLVLPGERNVYYGVGIEFFPIKDSKNVRIHAFWYSGNNNLSVDGPQSWNKHNVGIGFKWRLVAFERK
ncbi:MAG: hypothetical protein J6B65_03750 [Paludibacteraceae bacterium]|nr:hypothetical protein [Paludibacteraceae bacterium]